MMKNVISSVFQLGMVHGLGLSDPTSLSAFQYHSSAKLTAHLVDLVLSGSNSIPGNRFDIQKKIKNQILMQGQEARRRCMIIDAAVTDVSSRFSEKQSILWRAHFQREHPAG